VADSIALAQASKQLTFRLGSEEYGLEIGRVHEIIGIRPITSVPKTPEYVRGVINLRGRVIPVIDLRKKFEMPAFEDTDRTCIIVVQVTASSGAAVMGLVVDEVSEVVDIGEGEVEETPEFGTGVVTDYVKGIGKISDRVVMLLDIDRVLSRNEASVVERIASQA